MITVNGKEIPYQLGKTLKQILADLDMDATKGIAIAVNERVVARTNWETYPVNDFDKILVIKAAQGG